MMRGPIEIKAVLNNRYGQTQGSPDVGGDEAAIPWTFNQILQPIILILTFVILTQILGYKKAFVTLLGVVGKDVPRVEYAINIMNYQLQKLHLALEKVKDSVKESYKASRFADADAVHRDGMQLLDVHFKVFCIKTKELFDKTTYDQQARQIYSEVLNRAGVRDPMRIEPFVFHHISINDNELTKPEVRMMDDREYAETLDAKPDEISSRNRRIIRKAILDFCEGLKRQAMDVQYQLIKEIFDEISAGSSSLPLSKQNRELIEKMLAAQTKTKVRQRLAREFYRNMIEEWENRFEAEGYSMVKIVWDSLRSL